MKHTDQIAILGLLFGAIGIAIGIWTYLRQETMVERAVIRREREIARSLNPSLNALRAAVGAQPVEVHNLEEFGKAYAESLDAFFAPMRDTK